MLIGIEFLMRTVFQNKLMESITVFTFLQVSLISGLTEENGLYFCIHSLMLCCFSLYSYSYTPPFSNLISSLPFHIIVNNFLWYCTTT